MRTTAARAARLLASWVVPVLLGACSSGPGTGLGPPDPIVNVLETRIDAIPGRTLVIPIELGTRFDPRVPVPVRIGGTRQIAGEVYRVSIRPEDPTGLWLPPAGTWEATPAVAAIEGPDLSPGTLASWMIVVSLPPSAAGQTLWISEKQVNVNWLTSQTGPGVVRPADEQALGPIILRTVRPTPATERLLDPERTSPVRRWRYRLYTDGLARGADAVGERLRFSNLVLEAIATQNEDRWGYALRVIRKSDEELAMRLARRLAMVADFGNGVIAPAWPVSQGDLETLLTDLLDPRFDPTRRASRVVAWLDGQQPAVGWVIDDAGSQDAVSGGTLTAVGLLNLGDKPEAAFASARIGGPSVEVAMLPPGYVERLLIATSQSSGSGEEDMDLRVGRWSAQAPSFTGRIAAEPPGLKFGPLVPDYSMRTWIGSMEQGTPVPSPESGGLAAGLVYRKSGPGAASGPGDWVLYIECLRQRAQVDEQGNQAPSREDTVRVWIGLSGRPRLVLRVGESGYAHIESMRGSEGGTATAEAFGVSVVSRQGKWVCQIPIPAICFEPDGTLRLGLERTDSLGRRSAFPRPMLPWQTEPGRVAIDTSTW